MYVCVCMYVCLFVCNVMYCNVMYCTVLYVCMCVYNKISLERGPPGEWGPRARPQMASILGPTPFTPRTLSNGNYVLCIYM